MVTYLSTTTGRRSLPSPANLSKMPKKAKQQAPQQESSSSLVEEEAVPGVPDDVPDVPAVHDVPDVPDVEVERVVATQPRKRVRPSKKDIPDYPFTDEQMREIANYVQDHPELYDKRNENWQNPMRKENIWKDLAQHFPKCSHLQVKKLVEKKRTDFGKIEKKESKSGSASRQRTPREQKIVELWGFLAGHIAHETTQTSDDFSRRDDPESSSAESALSAHSLARRKRLKERHMEERPSPKATKSTTDSTSLHELVETAKELIARKPPEEGPDADIRQFVEFMYTRLKKVSPMHHGVLFSKIASLISHMEEPVMGRSAIKDPRRLLDSVAMPPAVAGPSQQWQPPVPPTPAPLPPVYHQPHYQPPQYPQLQYSQPQFQQQPYQQQPADQPPVPQQPQQQQVPTPPSWDSMIAGFSPSPAKLQKSAAELRGHKMKSPLKRVPMSPMIETPKGPEEDDSD